MIVLDASATVEFLLGSQRGQRIGDRLGVRDRDNHAPHLMDIEVAHVLRRAADQGRLSETRAREALVHLAQLRLTRWAHDTLLPRVWSLRHNATAYDAAYLALAEALGAPLLTCDASLADLPGHDATVEVVV